MPHSDRQEARRETLLASQALAEMEKATSEKAREKAFRVFFRTTSILASIAAAVVLWWPKRDPPKTPITHNATQQMVLEAKVRELETMIAKLARAESEVARLESSARLGQGPAYSTMMSEVRQLRQEVETIKGAIDADVSKTLALPLLRKDLNALKEHQKSESDSLRAEFTRSFEILKWMMGVMAASNLGLGALGLVKKS